MAEQRVWRINLHRAEGTNTHEPGVVEIAAPTKEAAIVILTEHLMELLTDRDVVLDTTREYIGAAAMGDRWEPDYGQYEPGNEEIRWHRLVYDAAKNVRSQTGHGKRHRCNGGQLASDISKAPLSLLYHRGSGAQGVKMMASVLTEIRDMSRGEWLKARTQGIGGSDAAAIAGLNPWVSPVQVWLEKTGQIESPDLSDNESVYWGTVLEDVVAREFATRTGMWVQRRNAILVHPEHEYMIGNVDRLIRPERGSGEWGVLEVKTTSEYAKGLWSDDEVPAHYLIQLQHYLAVTGYSYGYLAVLIGGNKYKHLRVQRDEGLIAFLVEIERRFWHEHVVAGVPPAWDGTEASTDLLSRLYPEGRPEEIALPAEAAELIARYEEAAEAEKDWARRKSEASNRLKGLLGESELGRIGERRVTWKNVATHRLDTKALQADHPEIYSEYVKPSVYRRFGIR